MFYPKILKTGPASQDIVFITNKPKLVLLHEAANFQYSVCKAEQCQSCKVGERPELHLVLPILIIDAFSIEAGVIRVKHSAIKYRNNIGGQINSILASGDWKGKVYSVRREGQFDVTFGEGQNHFSPEMADYAEAFLSAVDDGRCNLNDLFLTQSNGIAGFVIEEN